MKRRDFIGLVSALPFMGWLGTKHKHNGFIPENIGCCSLSAEHGHVLWTSFYPPSEGMWIEYKLKMSAQWFEDKMNPVLCGGRAVPNRLAELLVDKIGMPGVDLFTLTDLECWTDTLLTYKLEYDQYGMFNKIGGTPYMEYAKRVERQLPCGPVVNHWIVSATGLSKPTTIDSNMRPQTKLNDYLPPDPDCHLIAVGWNMSVTSEECNSIQERRKHRIARAIETATKSYQA